MTSFHQPTAFRSSSEALSPIAGEGAEPAQSQVLRTLEHNFKDHQICFVVPAGARIDATATGTLDLPGGMLVLGALRGRVTCAKGSILVAKGGEFQGIAEADDIYIEGRITSLPDAEMSRIKARGQVSLTGVVSGGVIALSAYSSVLAHMQARSFHIPRHSNLNTSVMEAI